MEQWRNGRRELFEQLKNVCNNIEQNLSNELVDGENTIIRKDELEKLHSKVNAYEADEENRNRESLQQKERIRALEEAISKLKEDLRSNRNAAARADRLDEENKRLAEDLKKFESATSKIEDLEEQNKRLSIELSNAAIRAKDSELSSTDHERSSSFGNGEVPSMGRKLNYKELWTERKRVKEQWLMQKERADKLVETVREKNAKLREWEAWRNEQNLSFTDEAGKPDAQKQDTRKSRSKSRAMEENNVTKPGVTPNADRVNTVPPPGPSTSFLTTAPKEPQAVEDNREFELGDSEQEQDGNGEGDHEISQLPKDSRKAQRVDNVEETQFVPIEPYEQDHNEEEDYESPQLPRHTRRSQRLVSVEETQFVPIEPYHSSSTQDPESALSGGGENAVVNEPNLETPKMPSSDGLPEFVSARPVRKRKRNERESQRTPMPKVKIESLGSSSPIIARILHASESLDLDDIGDKVVTPRKRRRAFKPYAEDVENEVENEVHDEMLLDGNMDEDSPVPTPITTKQPMRTMITPASKRGKSSVSKPLRQLSTNSILPNTVDLKLPAKRQRKLSATIRGVEQILEDGESTSPEKTPASVKKGRIHSTDLLDNLLSSSPPAKITAYPTPQSAAPEIRRSVILPPSKLSNETTTSRLDQQKILDTTPSVPKHRDDFDRQDATPVPRKRAAVDVEDIDVVNKDASHPPRGIKKEISRPDRRASVSNEDVEPVKKPVGRPRTGIMREISKPSSRASRKGSATSIEQSPERTTKASRNTPILPTKSTPKSRLGSSKPPTTTKKGPKRGRGEDLDSDDPEQEPYRLRPLATLKLDHFKINPNFNQGYDFAYTEVVRGKDRQCLPGCVREECCGKQFGALAEALYPTRENPTMSQKEEENVLLEEYLGDNKHKIWTMGKQERQEVLAQARKWKISNTMGKHRNVVPRRNTPPGFWEADFPNTQEDEALRKKQKEAERAKVAERYTEAMRPGGAWMFKDE